MRTRRGARLRAAVLVVGIAMIAVACNNGMTVDQKAVYTGAATTTITGTLSPAPDGHDHISSVTVNGIDATINGNTYSAVIPLDGTQIFNRVLVVSTWSDGEVITERRTVVYGDGTHSVVIPMNTMLSDGLRINDSALNALSGVVKNNTPLDLSTITPKGDVIYETNPGGYPDERATINQAPTISSWNIALAPQPGQVHAQITLSNLNLQLYIDTNLLFGIFAECGYLDVHSDAITIDANIGLQPKAGDATHLDVNLLGSPQVQVGAFNLTTTWDGGVCDTFQSIVQLFLPNMQNAITTGLQTVLSDQSDGTKSPIATAMENALANVNVSGPIGQSLGVTFTSDISNVAIDDTGINLQTHSSFVASSVAPGAPNLSGLLAYFDGLGALPATTPGGLPYDVAVGVSGSSFNQLLASETERGLLNFTISDLNGQSLTMRTLVEAAGGSGTSIPDSANYPLSIDFSPEVAPIVSLGAGSNGRPANLEMSGYRAVIKRSDTGDTMMDLALDFELPISVEVQNGLLQFVVDPPPAGTLHVDTVKSSVNLSPDAITALVQNLSGRLVQSVSQSLQGFPLPQFAGLTLTPVEFARVGTGLVFFATLG